MTRITNLIQKTVEILFASINKSVIIIHFYYYNIFVIHYSFSLCLIFSVKSTFPQILCENKTSTFYSIFYTITINLIYHFTVKTSSLKQKAILLTNNYSETLFCFTLFSIIFVFIAVFMSFNVYSGKLLF